MGEKKIERLLDECCEAAIRNCGSGSVGLELEDRRARQRVLREHDLLKDALHRIYAESIASRSGTKQEFHRLVAIEDFAAAALKVGRYAPRKKKARA